jgi:hypothetical protein
MIRKTTPLPRRPSAERVLLDKMLHLLRGKPPLTGDQVVRIVKPATGAAAVDIRMMLCPPYFRLVDGGWVCIWRIG